MVAVACLGLGKFGLAGDYFFCAWGRGASGCRFGTGEVPNSFGGHNLPIFNSEKNIISIVPTPKK